MNFRNYLIATLGSQLLTLSFAANAAAPLAVDDSRNVSRNFTFTINVLDNDSDPDGDAISVLSITSPTLGQATLNADGGISYISPTDAAIEERIDTFTYVLGDDSEEGLTSTATVTIRIRGAYEDLAEGDNEVSLAQALGGVCDQLLDSTDGEITAAQALLRDRCIGLETISNNADGDPSVIAAIVAQITPEETTAQTRVAIDSNRTQVKTVAQRVQQQKTARLNNGGQNTSLALNGRQHSFGGDSKLSPTPGAGDEDWGLQSRLGVFANIQLETAEREKTSLENGYDADTNGVTVGADYFLNTSTLIGGTFGYSQNQLDYLNNDGGLDADVTTISIFGAYFLDDFSFYLQGAYGWLDYASERNISYGSGALLVDERVVSTTGGSQLGLNSRVDWQWSRNALTLTPFLRLDYLTTDIDAHGEQGTSGLEMSFEDQSSSQLSLALGLQGSYSMNTSWGVFMPNAGFTYLSEANSDRDPITARFAVDPEASRVYSLINDGGDSSFYQLSIGASAIFPRGISAFLDYTAFLGYDHLDASQIQFGVRGEF